MAVGKITLAAVEALGPGETLWDETVKGFGVRRQRHAAVYVLKHRRQGTQRFVTIGKHGGPWTPATARDEARRLIGGQWDQPTSEGLTFGTLAQDYLARYARLHKKPRSIVEDERNLELHILPALGHIPVEEITRDVVAQFHADQRSRPANGNRCLALISHIFTMAERWGVTAPGSNPCRGLERFEEVPRERYLSPEELSRLGRVLARAEREESVDRRALAVIRLLIYTGARLSEILTLEWRFINWDQGYARLPDAKAGARTLTLPGPALGLLRKLRDERQGDGDGQYVFPGKRKGTWFTSIQKPWQKLRRDAGLDDVHIHDLRHSFASLAVASGESLYLVGHVLGHRRAITTQRYAHVAVAPMLEVANRTAERVKHLMEGTSDGK